MEKYTTPSLKVLGTIDDVTGTVAKKVGATDGTYKQYS
jgi:hypothetical protein